MAEGSGRIRRDQELPGLMACRGSLALAMAVAGAGVRFTVSKGSEMEAVSAGNASKKRGGRQAEA